MWLRVPSPAATTTTTSTSAVAVQQRGQVEQGPAVGVEPDQQPAGALDDHGVLTASAADPLGVRRHGGMLDACAPGRGVGCERLVERVHSSDGDAGEPAHLAASPESPSRDAGLHGLHDQ